MKKLTSAVFVAAIALLFVSCSQDIYKTVYPTLSDGKYDSEFPYRSSSEQLEQISNTTKLINCIAFYESHVFEVGHHITNEKISDETIEKYASQQIRYTNSSSGTATVIYAEENKVALLTTAHILDFPDTVITYYATPDGRETPYIQSLSVKKRQSNYVADFPEGGELGIILMDADTDIAIVGRRFEQTFTTAYPVFEYPTGKAAELDWGSFVYVFGYPSNYKMISKGIVSSPNRNGKGSFLLDATFSRGYSGGIVLAIRDGVPNFELVGLVRAVPAVNEYILTPSSEALQKGYNPLLPYTGDPYVTKKTNITYGITKVISIEEILEYLKKHEDYLVDLGYYIKLISNYNP